MNLESFVRKHGLGNIAASTLSVQESILKQRIYPHFPDAPLEWITEEALEAFQQNLTREVSAAYTNGILRTLRKVLRRAVRRGLLVRCPDFPRRLREKSRLAFTVEERDAFLKAFESDPDKLFLWARELFALAFETGLSRADLLSLRWEEVDIENGWIIRERQKTGVASRIPLSDRCQQALEVCQNRRRKSPFVLVTTRGRLYAEVMVRRYFLKAKLKAKLDRPLCFHSIRHFYGSNLASRGVPLMFVMAAMGHSDLQTTQRYAKVDSEALRAILVAQNSGFSH